MKILAIVNPAAGRPQPVLRSLHAAFCECDVDWDVALTRADVDAAELTRRALDDGADVVAVCGGDGTVACAAGALVGQDVPLAILPGGTGNAIAQDLGVPLDLQEAASVACDPNARLRRMDVLRFDDRVGLLRCGLGADGRMVQGAPRDSKDRMGWFAYLSSTIRQLTDPQLARYDIDLDGRELSLRGLTCLVVNIGRIGRSGLAFDDDISPFDGLLDVLVVRDASFESITSMSAKMLSGTGVDDDLDAPVVHLRGAEVRVEIEPAQAWHADGEALGDVDDFSARVDEGALPVLLPAAAAD